jgi:hypothetical protein
MISVGVDYSITSPAATVFNSETGEIHFYAFRQKKRQVSKDPRVTLLEMPLYASEEERHYLLATTLYKSTLGRFNGLHEAFLENYAYAGSGQVFNIAEATGCFKQTLFQAGIPIKVFQPTSVKKLATDRGNATKGEMYLAFEQVFPGIFEWIDEPFKSIEKIPSPISDIIDSYWVLQTGLRLKAEGAVGTD